ncbi:MAG: GyrI-like domain-containing protein [Candidatus Limnocylindria bacterium]
MALLTAVDFARPAARADEFVAPSGAVRFVDLPVHRFVMIDGEGKPGDMTFAPRMPGLYATAYTLHFALKRRGVVDRIGPLEGLWWPGEGAAAQDMVTGVDQGGWHWTLLIGLPDEASPEELEAALAAGRAKLVEPFAANLRIEAFEEGRAAQVMHLGPYDAEGPTIERLHAAIAAAGLRVRGAHHELYLGDPRRSAPARLRTLVRQPVD